MMRAFGVLDCTVAHSIIFIALIVVPVMKNIREHHEPLGNLRINASTTGYVYIGKIEEGSHEALRCIAS